MKWPKLPTMVMGAGGPIKVRLIKRVTGEAGEPCYGTWEPSTRTIRIERCGLLQHRHKTLFHELMHATMDDAGLCHLLSPDAQETLCDCVASARMAEMRHALGG
jgi:Zn-dependent peptidase ImmA (M78 family)